MRYWLLMPAAGSGSRFGANGPKQYAPLAGRTVIEWALAPFLADARCAHIVVALARGRSEEHTSELQSQSNLVCRLLLENKHTPCTVDTFPHHKRRPYSRPCPLAALASPEQYRRE